MILGIYGSNECSALVLISSGNNIYELFYSNIDEWAARGLGDLGRMTICFQGSVEV